MRKLNVRISLDLDADHISTEELMIRVLKVLQESFINEDIDITNFSGYAQDIENKE